MRIAWTLFCLLLLLAGIILLQVFLSKRESKWWGLALPILFFLWSFIYPLNMAALSASVGEAVFQMILVWLLGNIPTAVLLVIYFACREKGKRKKQLEKMNIMDLN